MSDTTKTPDLQITNQRETFGVGKKALKRKLISCIKEKPNMHSRLLLCSGRYQ